MGQFYFGDLLRQVGQSSTVASINGPELRPSRFCAPVSSFGELPRPQTLASQPRQSRSMNIAAVAVLAKQHKRLEVFRLRVEKYSPDPSKVRLLPHAMLQFSRPDSCVRRACTASAESPSRYSELSDCEQPSPGRILPELTFECGQV
jgi:hypothetical protein